MPNQKIDERELFDRALAGDLRAKDELFASVLNYLDKALRSLRVKLVNLKHGGVLPWVAMDGNDLKQDALEKLHQCWHTWQGRNGASFKTWAFKVFRNVMLQRVNKVFGSVRKQGLPSELDDRYLGHQPQNLEDPLDGIIAEEDFREQADEKLRLSQLVNNLPTLQKEVLVLRFGLNGQPALSMKDVGVVLGVSVDVIKGRQHRAVESLRRLMGAGVVERQQFRLPRTESRRSRRSVRTDRSLAPVQALPTPPHPSIPSQPPAKKQPLRILAIRMD